VQAEGIFCREKTFFHRGSGVTQVSERWVWIRRALATRLSRRTFVICVIGLAATLSAPLRSNAQLPQLQAPPGWGKVPQGTGACSVEKSCADLAPGMIRDALGASPLEQNIRALAGLLAAGRNGSPVAARASSWVEGALRSAGADEVRIEKIGSPDAFESVEAEIRGREFPADYVLIPATWGQNGTAARAAAENVAVLIDAVRVIHSTGNIPRRSIRFVFLTGPGQGAGGNEAAVWAYVRQHLSGLDHITVAVSTDVARGPLNGYSVEDRPGMLAGVRDALGPLRSLGVRDFSEGVEVRANSAPFWLEGIPTLVATSTDEEITPPGSARAGLERSAVDATMLRQLKRGVAVAAVTAYALADAQTRLAPRRSATQVEHSIDSLGIKAELKATGAWKQWQALEAQENH
jgi:hypothetical protein